MFWENVLANFISDFAVAVLIGLVLAFYINKKEQKTTLLSRREEVLRLIKKELLRNGEYAEESIKTLQQKGTLDWPGLRNESWSAFVNSGQLEWVTNDLELLHLITGAYHYIDAIKISEHLYLEGWMHYQGSDRQGIVNRLAEDLIKGYESYRISLKDFLNDERVIKISIE